MAGNSLCCLLLFFMAAALNGNSLTAEQRECGRVFVRLGFICLELQSRNFEVGRKNEAMCVTAVNFARKRCFHFYTHLCQQ